LTVQGSGFDMVTRAGRRARALARVALVLALTSVTAVATALVGTSAADAAAVCQDSSPAGTYVVRICLSAPADGSTLSGKVAVTATASVVSGTGPGFQRMVFSLNGQYLLTDYSRPYTFTLDTRRFVDGSYTLAVHGLLRDTKTTPDTTIGLTFANGITTVPVNTGSWTPPQGNPATPGRTYTVVAAGDGAGGESSETAVTNLIASMDPNLTLYLGDVYEKGTSTEFDNWYGPPAADNTFYGRFRDITLPTVGNHEYTAGHAPGYFDYWNNIPHYYSVNRNGWHIVSLDANPAYRQTSVGSGQYTWLQNDLDNNTQPCTLVFYHEPRFNIGDEGASPSLDALWSLMASKGVDLVINGHDHTYQRYLPLDGTGHPNAAGVTEIINGAGGHALGAFPNTDSRLAASAQQFGALKLGLNPAGAAYQFVNTSGAVVDSGSTKCDTTKVDTQPPTAPTNLTATSPYKTTIDLSWTPPTDDVGVTGYRIFRDGTRIDTIAAGSAYTDTTVAPGSTHSYTVRAVDAAGNVSPASNTASATTPAVSVLFHDGFETGDMSHWTNPGGNGGVPNSGLTVQATDAFSGTYAARALAATVGSNGASAWKTLAKPEPNLYYEARFKVTSHNTALNLLRMRNGLAGSNPIVSLGLATTNRLTLRNDGGAAPVTITSSRVASPGVWHDVQLHARVNGTSSATEVWLDGTKVADLSRAPIDLGAHPVAKVELGDPGSVTQSFDVRFDDVAVDRTFIGDVTAPTAPTDLKVLGTSATSVTLGWGAATDDVGVTGYRVYRDGARVATLDPSARTYTDTSLAGGHQYTYRVTAVDAAGNESPTSGSVTATTAGDSLSAPGAVRATALGDTSIAVTWSAPTGGTAVTGYDVYRDGGTAPVGSVDGSTLSFTDHGLSPDTTYSYTVRSRDAAGDASVPTAAATARTWVFADGFETADLSRWSTSRGLVTSTVQKASGSYGAIASAGRRARAAFAVRSLPSTYRDLTYQVKLLVPTSAAATTDFLRLRTASGSGILALTYSRTGLLGYHNDVRRTSTSSRVSVRRNVWHRATVRVRIRGARSRVDVWLDGHAVRALSKVDNLGRRPVGQVVVGETIPRRGFRFAVDDVQVTR
jgi:fibronectin type 3 domain-containing protein